MGDWEANLRRAIACFEETLRIYQMAHVDYYVSMVSSNLKVVRDEIRSLEQGKEDHEEVVDE
jgi:hypothetical protein